MCEDNSKDNKLLVLEKKIKMVEYTSKQLYSINNMVMTYWTICQCSLLVL